MNKQALLALLNTILEGCKLAVKIMPVIIAVAGGVTAVTPHVDEKGNPSQLHQVLDILALNILNSSHDVNLGDLHKDDER